MPLVDLAFLTRDNILLLLKEEEVNTLLFGLFSVPERKIVIRCRLPFLGWRVQFLRGSTTIYGDHCLASRAKMLQPNLRHRIVALRSWDRQFGTSRTFYVILHTGKFLDKCKDLLNSSVEAKSFEWSEWGPGTTSCIPRSVASPLDLRSIFGSYMLVFGRPNKWIEGCTDKDDFLMLLDFNQIPIQRGYEERSEDDYYLCVIRGSDEWYKSSSRLPAEHIISTSLPYRAFMRRWRPYEDGLAIEANTIVANLVRHPFIW
jgi:hypothetical protein